jgi:histidinol-phosphate aminotransferase
VTDPLRVHGDELARGAAVDMAVNVLAGGPPPWLYERILDGLNRIDAYPDERAAVAAVAARHARPPDEVVLVNGASQAFPLLAHAVPTRRPVCVHPSFTEPEAALRAAGRDVRRVVLAPPYALTPAAVPDDADLVVLGNPTNPTGVLHARDTIAALCRPGRVTVVDEAFMDFVPGEPESVASDRALPGLVVVRSLTKLYGLPGLRAGYVLAAPDAAQALRVQRPAWSLNTPALAAIEACVAARSYAERVAAQTASARIDLIRRLRAVPGLTVHPGAANFLLVHARNGAEHCARLRERGIVVRSCHTFPGLTDDHLRITVREPSLHAQIARALAEDPSGGEA